MPEDLLDPAETFAPDQTRVFADLAVEKGLVARERMDECVEILGKMREMGLESSLQEVLLKKGYLTEAQVKVVGKALGTYKRIGGYEIVARIGQGAMGAVFKARQISMDRMVALKILPSKLATDTEYVDRFLREARAVAKLNHVNIIQGIDVGEADGYYYFAMEYV